MRKVLLLGIAAILFVGCDSDRADSKKTYTLYRNSIIPNLRIHIATFDALESGTYNQDNCQTAKKLFQNQSKVEVDYWCELGTYKKEIK